MLQEEMEWQRRWMGAFAKLVYVVERGKKTVTAARTQAAQEKRRQLAQQTSLPRSAAQVGWWPLWLHPAA